MPYAQRQKLKLQSQQPSSKGSCMPNTSSPSKTHRRTSSFTRQLSDDSDSSISVKSTTIKVMDPFNISGINSRSDDLPQGHDMKDCYTPQSSKSGYNFLACEDDISLPALELIRELSFGMPRPHKTEKRCDTAGTVTSSSSSEMSLDHPEDHSHITSPVGLDLDLKPSRDARARSLSPLLGLQYLPDHEDILI